MQLHFFINVLDLIDCWLLLKKTQREIDFNSLFFKKDLRDKSIFNIFKKYKIDCVIHFAGLKSIDESIKRPLLYWDNNVKGSICLFNIMEKFNCRNIAFSSSATIYGNPKEKFFSEDTTIQPMNPYGYTKLTIEKILKDIFISSNKEWKIANLRYFNPIGAHPSGLIGESFTSKSDNLFPHICMVATGAKK